METNKDLQNKKRLGRGIGSLLGGASFDAESTESTITNETTVAKTVNTQKNNSVTTATQTTVEAIADTKRVWSIAIDKLVPGIFQPRKHFKKEQLDELAQSIKENGIIQPLTVRKRDAGGYEIIAGERRWRASQIAGLHEVPAIIKDITDKEALEMALIENIQREDLDPIEEAEGYQRLMQEFTLSQQQVAERVGKERSTVANALRLIALPFEIKEMIVKNQISAGHAKVLLGIEDKATQIKLAKQVADKQMSVRGLEAFARLQKGASDKNKNDANTSKNALNTDLSQRLAKELADQMQKSLGTKVEMNYKSGKGSLTIHFYSDEQLNTIYEKIK